MHIDHLIRAQKLRNNSTFDPDEFSDLDRIFSGALAAMDIDRNGPTAAAVALELMERARMGERNPTVLSQSLIRQLMI